VRSLQLQFRLESFQHCNHRGSCTGATGCRCSDRCDRARHRDVLRGDQPRVRRQFRSGRSRGHRASHTCAAAPARPNTRRARARAHWRDCARSNYDAWVEYTVWTSYGRSAGAALTIAPRAARSASSLSGTHSTTHRTVLCSQARSTVSRWSASVRSCFSSFSSFSNCRRAETPFTVFMSLARSRSTRARARSNASCSWGVVICLSYCGPMRCHVTRQWKPLCK